MTATPPHLEIAYHEAIAGARFHLVEANVSWTDEVRSSGWGRDRDPEIAKWKAISEAVERYGYLRPPPLVFAAAHELPGWLHPDALVRYTPRQFAGEEFPFAPFDPAQPRYWTAARTVLSGEMNYVLADTVCNPRAFPPEYRKHLVTHASTSGCASADSLELAILRATLELIERDAFMRHWFAQSPGHPINLSTVPHAMRQRFDVLAGLGCAVGLQWLHMSSHPTWLAWAQHPEKHFTCIGSAAALNSEAGLETALNELETLALARAEGVPAQDIAPREVRAPADHAALYATRDHFRRADALWSTALPARSFSEASEAFGGSASKLYERLAESGHPPYWIDLSIPEAASVIDGRPIRTVRALAPGLIPMAFGYGRLPLGMDKWHRTDAHSLHPFA